MKLSVNLVKEYVELIDELTKIKQEKEFENNISYSKYDYIFNEFNEDFNSEDNNNNDLYNYFNLV